MTVSLLSNSIFEADIIMREAIKMVASDLLIYCALTEMKETCWVSTFRREMTKQLLDV